MSLNQMQYPNRGYLGVFLKILQDSEMSTLNVNSNLRFDVFAFVFFKTGSRYIAQARQVLTMQYKLDWVTYCSADQTGSQQIAQVSLPILISQCWDDRHVFPFSEKTYYPKTALIQILTSA